MLDKRSARERGDEASGGRSLARAGGDSSELAVDVGTAVGADLGLEVAPVAGAPARSPPSGPRDLRRRGRRRGRRRRDGDRRHRSGTCLDRRRDGRVRGGLDALTALRSRHGDGPYGRYQRGDQPRLMLRKQRYIAAHATKPRSRPSRRRRRLPRRSSSFRTRRPELGASPMGVGDEYAGESLIARPGRRKPRAGRRWWKRSRTPRRSRLSAAVAAFITNLWVQTGPAGRRVRSRLDAALPGDPPVEADGHARLCAARASPLNRWPIVDPRDQQASPRRSAPCPICGGRRCVARGRASATRASLGRTTCIACRPRRGSPIGQAASRSRGVRILRLAPQPQNRRLS